MLLSQAASPRAGLAAALFSSAMIALYAASTLYHWAPPGFAKRLFLAFDHAAIYLLIAGSYAPFALLALAPEDGSRLLALVAGLATAGIALQVALFASDRKAAYERIAPLLHLGFGWIPLLAYGRAVAAALSWPALSLLVAGGLAYSLGVVALRRETMRYNHAIWHLAVVAGTALHFGAVLTLV